MSKYPIHPAKRLFDILFSFGVLLGFSPAIAFFLIGIALEHLLRLRPFDPLFYSEVRYSQGKPFTIYKFNIFKYDVVLRMRARGEFVHTKDLEHNGSLLFIGWFLKQIYLDELPQFFNILRGDMSVVGPRPVNKVVFDTLVARGILDKTKVKAGLTGHYQSYKQTAGMRSEDLDREYVVFYEKNPWYRILLFDMRIMLRTVLVILRARGV